MAIYHLNFRRCSKSKGQSAGAKFDYINREDKYNKKQDDLMYSESGNIPDFAKDNPKEFWNYADQFERSNARVCTEIEFALPRELDINQQKELINQFIKNNLDNDKHKLAYSFAIHNDKENNNPHCHLIFSERNIDGIERTAEQFFKRANGKNPDLGGAKKSEYANNRDFVQEVRTSWRKAANEHLKKHGYDVKIDERTLQDQGINRESPIRLNRIEFKKLKELEVKSLELSKEIAINDIDRNDVDVDFYTTTAEYLRKDYQVNQNVRINPHANKPLFGLFMSRSSKDEYSAGKREKKRIKSEFDKNKEVLKQFTDKKSSLTEVLTKINEKIKSVSHSIERLNIKKTDAPTPEIKQPVSEDQEIKKLVQKALQERLKAKANKQKQQSKNKDFKISL